MKKQRIINLTTIILLISTVLCSIAFETASALTINPYTFSGATANAYYLDEDWTVNDGTTADNGVIAVRVSYTSDWYLREIVWNVKRIGTPTFLVKCALYNSTTTTGTIDQPLESSQNGNVGITGLSTSFSAQLTFSFAGNYKMSANTYYYIALIAVNAQLSVNRSHCLQINSITAGETGWMKTYDYNEQWGTIVETNVLQANVWGNTLPAVTPTPIPTPSPTPVDDYKWDENTDSWSWWNGTHWIPSSGPSPTANAQITTFTGNMITYIVPCLLLLLPAVVGAWALGKAGAAKWGFIAGLNIGAIMCYLYLPTFGLWAVIAIVLVDIVMIFASQRGE